MYVGFAMTAQKEIENTAYIDSNVELIGETVGKAINIGETVNLDFSTSDKENDETEFKLISELPEGAKRRRTTL